MKKITWKPTLSTSFSRTLRWSSGNLSSNDGAKAAIYDTNCNPNVHKCWKFPWQSCEFRPQKVPAVCSTKSSDMKHILWRKWRSNSCLVGDITTLVWLTIPSLRNKARAYSPCYWVLFQSLWHINRKLSL